MSFDRLLVKVSLDPNSTGQFKKKLTSEKWELGDILVLIFCYRMASFHHFCSQNNRNRHSSLIKGIIISNLSTFMKCIVI